MADSINWGLLQPLNQEAPIHAQATQATQGSAPAPNPNAGGGGFDLQGQMMARQELALKQQHQANENAMQPGLLQGQALNNQGKGIENQGAQIGLLKAQRDQRFQQNADTAFTTAKQKGADNEQAMDAYQGQLSPEAAQAFQSTRDTHQKAVIDNNATALSNAAGIVAQTQQELGTTHDPKQVNALLDNANKQLDRVDPQHTPIKSISDLHNYGIATLGTLMNPKVQATLNFELQKAKVTAQANTTGEIDKQLITDVNTAAIGGQKLLAATNQYEGAFNQIDTWNKQNPNKAVLVGPGFTGWESAKQKLAAVGGPTGALDQMETLSKASSDLFIANISTLKTLPRSEAILNRFAGAQAQPSDTSQAQRTQLRYTRYVGQNAVSEADFIAQYREINGDTTGAVNAYSKFINADPSLRKGGLPDPNWLSANNYMPFTNPKYIPPSDVSDKTANHSVSGTSSGQSQAKSSSMDLSQITPEMAQQELQKRQSAQSSPQTQGASAPANPEDPLNVIGK